MSSTNMANLRRAFGFQIKTFHLIGAAANSLPNGAREGKKHIAFVLCELILGSSENFYG